MAFLAGAGAGGGAAAGGASAAGAGSAAAGTAATGAGMSTGLTAGGASAPAAGLVQGGQSAGGMLDAATQQGKDAIAANQASGFQSFADRGKSTWMEDVGPAMQQAAASGNSGGGSVLPTPGIPPLDSSYGGLGGGGSTLDPGVFGDLFKPSDLQINAARLSNKGVEEVPQVPAQRNQFPQQQMYANGRYNPYQQYAAPRLSNSGGFARLLA